MLIAEFAMALRATQNQESDASDLRTQVQFSNLTLTGVTTTGQIEVNPAPSAGAPAMSGYPVFNIQFDVIEKVAAPDPGQPVSLLGPNGMDGSRIAIGK